MYRRALRVRWPMGMLPHLAVSKGYRGYGIGTGLFKLCQSEFYKIGINPDRGYSLLLRLSLNPHSFRAILRGVLSSIYEQDFLPCIFWGRHNPFCRVEKHDIADQL